MIDNFPATYAQGPLDETDALVFRAMGWPMAGVFRSVDPKLHGGVGRKYIHRGASWTLEDAGRLGLTRDEVEAVGCCLLDYLDEQERVPDRLRCLQALPYLATRSASSRPRASFAARLEAVRDLVDELSCAFAAGGEPALRSVAEDLGQRLGRDADGPLVCLPHMASSDFVTALDSLPATDTVLKVTTGTTKPNGGANFARVANSLTNAPGAVVSYITQAGFAPIASGCDISGALVRFTSGGTTGWSCFLLNSLAGTSVNDNCYMLGLSDADPSLVVLRKGPANIGIPDEDPGGAAGVLLLGTLPVAIDEWVHLRLEVVVQPFGDVFINCYYNDLASNSVQAPIWTPVPGMELNYNNLPVSFVDDALGINSGSAPYIGGRAGIGLRVDDITRRCGFDHIRVARQIAP